MLLSHLDIAQTKTLANAITASNSMFKPNEGYIFKCGRDTIWMSNCRLTYTKFLELIFDGKKRVHTDGRSLVDA